MKPEPRTVEETAPSKPCLRQFALHKELIRKMLVVTHLVKKFCA
jgi:hypothetical protein